MSFFDQRPASGTPLVRSDEMMSAGSPNAPEALRRQIEECEKRIASLMWVIGVIRRGVEWQEDSPILRLIDTTMAEEEGRGAPLGPNVARMFVRRRPPAPVDHADLDLA